MPRKSQRNWTKTGVFVAIILGGIAAFLTVVLSSLDMTTKEIMIVSLALLLYIVYNEVTKVYEQ